MILSKIISLIFFCLFIFSPVAGASPEEVINAAIKLGLSKNPTWLKLLHYDDNATRSAVLTIGFFISPNGKSDPEAELKATINAYFLPWDKAPNAQARCRYPARYYWLSRQLQLPDYKLHEEKCQSFEKWALVDTVESVSLLLVSGYLGNPASTFGHVLLKFNTDSIDDRSGLFDLTLNYGALVPDKEHALRYVVRGLFGGYKSGFSDNYFYTQDLVYSRTEFRDMWDYRLALTEYERTLLILHVWEILGNKFDYYFLDKNCAYRLGELVDLVIDEDLVRNRLFWYAPVKLFYRLEEINKARQKSKKENLIKSVRFIPSSQRVLYYQLKLLTQDELKAFNAIILDGPQAIPVQLAKIASERQILILDSLLAYQQYRLIVNKAKLSDERYKFKDQILLARLQLPAHLKPLVKIKELASPAAGSPPMVFGTSIATEAKKKTFLRLSWSPFKQDIVGNTSLEGDEIVILDSAVGLFKDEHKVFFDHLDLIRILNLKTLPVAVVDESRLSWQLRLGWDRINNNGNNQYDGAGSFGVGRAWKWNPNIIGYILVDLAGHTTAPYARARPHVGLKFDEGAIRTWIYSGAETVSYNGRFHEIWGGKMECQLTNRSTVSLDVSNEKATLASLGLNLYW